MPVKVGRVYRLECPPVNVPAEVIRCQSKGRRASKSASPWSLVLSPLTTSESLEASFMNERFTHADDLLLSARLRPCVSA